MPYYHITYNMHERMEQPRPDVASSQVACPRETGRAKRKPLPRSDHMALLTQAFPEERNLG